MSSTRLDESAPGGEGASAAPRTVEWAFWATIAWAVLSALTALSLVTARPYLRQALIDANAKSKTPVANYTGAKVDHDITHTYLIGGSVQAVLLAAILIMLGFLMRGGRGWARWMLLAFATVIPLVIPIGIGIVLQLLLGIIGDAPALYRVLRIAAGLASLAVVVLLVMPQSGSYFSAVRALAAPRGPRRDTTTGTTTGTTTDGAPVRRPGGLLGTLFAPRRPALGARTRAAGGTDPATPDETVAAEPGAGARPGGAGGIPARRAVATRPGSVKPKRTGARPGRAKSRQGSTDSNPADTE